MLMPKMPKRGARIMEAMLESAQPLGIKCVRTERWERRSRILMLYGFGHVERQVWAQQHMAQGGMVIAWDLGYWQRDEYMRVSVNGQHPRNMPRMPANRWQSLGLSLRSDHNQNGPVVLVGLGEKTRRQFGYAGQWWESQKLAQIRATYPCKEIVYRPKTPETLLGCKSVYGAIEDVIRGASLVVCRHSNVAIDACVSGIPVVCEDGAAVALYGNNLASPSRPNEAEREQFLSDLAWWQWKTNEATEAWKFLLRK